MLKVVFAKRFGEVLQKSIIKFYEHKNSDLCLILFAWNLCPILDLHSKASKKVISPKNEKRPLQMVFDYLILSYMKIFRCIVIFLWLNFVLDAILNMVNIAANILGAKTEDLTEGT